MDDRNANPKSTNDAMAIWKAGVAAVDARGLVQKAIRLDERQLHVADLSFARSDFDRVIVLGAGKASGWMAAGFEQTILDSDLPDRSAENFLKRNVTGWINVPDDQVVSLRSIHIAGCRPTGINLPTDRVLAGTERIMELARSASQREIVLFMIAGGGSALLEMPVEPISLDDFRLVTALLSQRGAKIQDLNTVRKAISQVKGGRLAAATNASALIGLVVSDIMGDPLEDIASGPTVPQDVSPEAALDVLKKYDSDLKQIPAPVLEVLTNRMGTGVILGRAGTQPAMPATDEDSRPHCSTHNRIMGNNETAVQAAAKRATELGYEVLQASTRQQPDDAEALGREFADQLLQMVCGNQKACVISGGEPICRPGDRAGRGGRNQHLVVAALKHLADQNVGVATAGDRFCLLSGGTDGEDGNVPVAGAWLDQETIRRVRSRHLHEAIRTALASFNSHDVLDDLGCLIRVAPTRTNVCDLRVMLTG